MGNKFTPTTAAESVDLFTPVRHVATELDKASPEALSVSDMASTYKHVNPGDIARVRDEWLKRPNASDHAVSTWFIEQAITALGINITANGDGYHLAKPLDAIRYKRRKINAYVEENEVDVKQLRRMINNDRNRTYEVITPGRKTPRKLRLHDLAKSLPTMSTDEFNGFVADVRAHGINKPVLVLGDLVLDGRHRVAVADAFNIPVQVESFDGTEEQAVDRVLSENVHRWQLTMAQRGLIVRELFLPRAQAEAQARSGRRTDLTSLPIGREVGNATDIAAKRSNGLATARTIDRMAPVDNAPKTKERIRSGDITTALQARKEALKEIGRHKKEPADVPAAKPESVYTNLGQAHHKIRAALKGWDAATHDDTVTLEKIRQRVSEIRAALDEVARLADE